MNLDSLSIEQFAAFLDGTLSASEMSDLTSALENNDMLHALVNANEVIEESISGMSVDDILLPYDTESPSFEIPQYNIGSNPLSFEDSSDPTQLFANINLMNDVSDYLGIDDNHTNHYLNISSDDVNSETINLRPDDNDGLGHSASESMDII